MASWKDIFRHTAAGLRTGKDDTDKSRQSVGTELLFWDSNGVPVPREKIEFSLKFVDMLSTLEAGLHTSDDPREIAHGAMKVACDFYQADWCGFLTVDLDLGIWTPYWWYNPRPADRTMQLTNEFESSAKLDRWINAMRDNDKVYVADAEAIKDEFPVEYEVYKRLHISSLLAVPVKPRPIGFLVVRNPRRFFDDERMLHMLAYVSLNAVNQHSYFERARMSLSPEAIESDRDVIFNVFGNLEFYTSKGVLREQDCNAPKCCRVVAYLLLHRKTPHPPLEIAEALWPEEDFTPEAVSNSIRGLIYRFRQAVSLISDYPLIESTSNGYRINPSLHIMTDIQQFDKLWEAVQNASATSIKVDLIKQAIALYKGQLFEDACHEHWIMPMVHTYNLRYIGLVNELLTKLAQAGDYPGIQQYAAKALEIMPGNIRAHYWLVFAMYHSGAIEMAKSEVARAKASLSEEEYSTLLRYLRKNSDMAPVTDFDDDFDL